MKKILVVAFAAAMFCSCAKESDSVKVPEPDGVPVVITFGDSNFSRAFNANSPAAEPWEKKVTSLYVQIFGPDGENIMRQSFSTGEVAALKGKVYLPVEAVGKTCRVYVIANYTPLYYPTEDRFLTNTITETEYLLPQNGRFPVVTTSSRRAEGFVMTGSADALILTEGNVTQISISLKRIVAKIAIEITIDPAFAASLRPGYITVTAGGFGNIKRWSYLLPGQQGPDYWRTMYVTQPSENFKATTQQFLIYIYEQGPFYNLSDYPELHISGFYYADGNIEGNWFIHDYVVPLQGQGNGTFRRNGYYRLKGTIAGFDHLEIQSTIEVDEWEMPHTEDVGELTGK